MSQHETPTDPKSHAPVDNNATPLLPRVEAALRYAACDFHTLPSFAIISMVDSKELAKLDIAIPLDSISRITLSPWAHESLSAPMKTLLKSIEGCGGLEIVRSTLIGNKEWKNIGTFAA